MIDLTGRVALVTGSSRGMGKACAIRLAQAGADVIVNYVTSRGAAIETAEEIRKLGRRAFVIKADVSEVDDVQSMLEYVSEQIGQLDILVSNAASGGFRALMAANRRHFENTYNTNVLALLYLVQASLPLLTRTSGRSKVIAISSHGSDLALPWYGLIGSSKAALESLARHLTLEVGDKGVNVNVVKSGLVETDSTRRIPNADEMFSRRTEKTMTGDRMLSIDDIADAVLYLASPLSDMVQGETLTVDGGTAVHV
ncbi:MAG: enoyl-[acyl-carrier protein] reductase III [Pirellulaceae bacterium]|jgi:enoyl-[acyl-carrier protein] reductase III